MRRLYVIEARYRDDILWSPRPDLVFVSFRQAHATCKSVRGVYVSELFRVVRYEPVKGKK